MNCECVGTEHEGKHGEDAIIELNPFRRFVVLNAANAVVYPC